MTKTHSCIFVTGNQWPSRGACKLNSESQINLPYSQTSGVKRHTNSSRKCPRYSVYDKNWRLSAEGPGIERFSMDDSQLTIEKAGMLISKAWKDYRRLSIDLDRWLSIDDSQFNRWLSMRWLSYKMTFNKMTLNRWLSIGVFRRGTWWHSWSRWYGSGLSEPCRLQ